MPPDFLDEVAARLRAAGVQDAITRRDSGPLFEWVMSLVALQGISDAVAFEFDARHGGVRWATIDAALAAGPACPRLASFWHFEGCRWRKTAGTCGSPRHLTACPVPALPTRKGLLAEAAFGFALFIRDVAGGDLVGWMDARLAAADPGPDAPGRAAALRDALLTPLVHIVGTGPKLWSMILSELLLTGDPARERWIAAGAGLIAVDSLVHNLLTRTGILKRLGAAHPYGPACYGSRGCAGVIAGLAARIDARAYNPAYLTRFDRWVQHALWRFAATGVYDVCNGRRIDDRGRCRQALRCPAYPTCDRVVLAR